MLLLAIIQRQSFLSHSFNFIISKFKECSKLLFKNNVTNKKTIHPITKWDGFSGLYRFYLSLMQIQKTLSFKSFLSGTLTASFTNIGAAKLSSEENWFRVHSGMQNKINTLSADTPPSFATKTTSKKSSVGSEVIRNSDNIQDSKLSTRLGLDDWKSPGARYIFWLYLYEFKTLPAFPSDFLLI